MGWLVQTARLEGYPDHILKQVADDLASRRKLVVRPTPKQLTRLCAFYAAMEQPPAPGKQALLAKLAALPPRPAWRGRYRWATDLVLYWRAADLGGYADAILIKTAKELAREERAGRQPYRPRPNELNSLCHHVAGKGRRCDWYDYEHDSDDDDDDDADWDMMINVALRYPELWSRWELEFLKSVKYYRRLSERQIDVIEALYDRAVAEGRLS